MNGKILPDGVTRDFWINTQEEDFGPVKGQNLHAQGVGQENLETSVMNAMSLTSDELIFDDDVPVVVRSRYKLCTVLARLYGLDTNLYDVGSTPLLKWVVLITGGELGEIIPVSCSTASGFTRTFHSAHGHLEAMYQRGFTPRDVVLQSDEADVSAPVKGDSAPI